VAAWKYKGFLDPQTKKDCVTITFGQFPMEPPKPIQEAHSPEHWRILPSKLPFERERKMKPLYPQTLYEQ
jgi:hypothetical protein